MSIHARLFSSAITLLLFLSSMGVSRAQSFGLGVSATPNPVVVSNFITYSIFVTNQTGLNLTDVFVTNSVSASVNYNQDGTNTIPGNVTLISGGVLFSMPVFNDGAVAQLTLKLAPLSTGSFTNQITVATFGTVITNATTNVVTTVGFAVADLTLGLTNTTASVFTNDTTTIGLFVTNLGPNTATGVVVTNPLPTGLKLLSVSPANASTNFSGGNLRWNIGTLASGVATQLLVTLQATNSGVFQLTANVTGGVNDTNLANNVATNILDVISFLAADLTVTVVTQSVSRQTGLLEMWVNVRNNAATNVPAIRVLATNLPSGTWLYNAVGTNSGVPYVSYNAPVLATSSVDLLLEFYRIPRAILTNYVPTALALPLVTVTPPATNGFLVTITNMASGGILLEFPATIGKTYTIIYADNTSFSNAAAAQPSIVAPATRVQWIDNGPPKTISHPLSSGTRLYRVQEGQ